MQFYIGNVAPIASFMLKVFLYNIFAAHNVVVTTALCELKGMLAVLTGVTYSQMADVNDN